MARNDRSSGRHLGFELTLALIGMALGFVVLPALIFVVGTMVLGPYAGGAHRLGSFYGDIFRDLGKGSPAAWGVVFGPYVLLLLLRIIFMRRQTSDEDEEDEEPPPTAPKEKVRKEPKVT